VLRVEHICLVLETLHWLPVKYCIDYKVALFVYEVQSTGSPLIFNRRLATTRLPDIFGRQRSSSYWSHQSELNLQDVHSAKLLQQYGTVCHLHHTLLRRTNNSDLLWRNIFMNSHLRTDHVTVSAPTIRSFFWRLTEHNQMHNSNACSLCWCEYIHFVNVFQVCVS